MFIVVVLVVLVGWAGNRFLRSAAVETTHPAHGPAVQAVYATGTVEAEVMMPIAARSAARLLELNVDEGSEVKKGQVLAHLEATDLQSSLETFRARENFAKKSFERNSTLRTRGAISEETYDRSKSDWEAARSDTARAEAEAGYMTLVAPADGRVIRRDGEVGQMIAINQPVFWLSLLAPLRITAEVDEEDISQVKTEQPVLIRADAFPGQVFRGKVKSITPKGDPIARSYRVRISLAEETPLQIGMTAETNIVISEKKDALLIPSTSIHEDKVWRVVAGKLEEHKVTLGAKGLGQTEVREGLDVNDEVVINPMPTFKAGQRVRTKLVQ